ncbi:MAG: TlpA family protein disulfide reductase [Pigmentiphaga sp.]|nr:TlpA family protein disulfide reductase [Pigmentiphaga sp.]
MTRPVAELGRLSVSDHGMAPAPHGPAAGAWSRRRWLGLALAVAGVQLAGCGRDESSPAAAAEIRALAALRAASLANLDGGTESLSQWAGQPWLVNFWATWCPPCVHEMPDLDRLQADFPQVRFIGLGIDSIESMRAFRERVPVGYPLLEARAEGLDWSRALGNEAGGLPFTFILDASGNLRYRVAGRIDPEVLTAQLRPLVDTAG